MCERQMLLSASSCLRSFGVFVCISSHLHVCSVFGFCASAQHVTPAIQALRNISLLSDGIWGGGGRIILYKETQGGREGGVRYSWCVCALQ